MAYNFSHFIRSYNFKVQIDIKILIEVMLGLAPIAFDLNLFQLDIARQKLICLRWF